MGKFRSLANVVGSKLPWVPRGTATDHPSVVQEGDVDWSIVAQIVPMLARQLSEVNADVENSIVGICSGFQGMAQRAQRAVNAAQEAIPTGRDARAGNDLISEMRQVLELLLDKVQASCEFSRQTSAKLTQSEDRLAAVETTLNDVEDISNRARLVALNGQIEASRLGESGRAFEVVSNETKTLSMHAAKTSESIRSRMSELTSELTSTSRAMTREAEESTRSFLESQEKVHQLLNMLDASNQQMHASLNVMAETSQALSTDIGRAVMSLQFQDRVTQRIGHVVEVLDRIVKAVERQHPSTFASSDRNNLAKWKQEIESRYTMDSERFAATGDAPASEQGENTSTEEFSVELF